MVVPLDARPDIGSVAEDPWVLADVLFGPCYVGGWSAAEHWGLTEQIFRSTFVVSAARVRASEAKFLGADFRIARVPRARIGLASKVWRQSEQVSVSDRELTIADGLASPAWTGGARHLFEVFASYRRSERWNPEALLGRLRALGRGAAFKRLGFFAETVKPRAGEVVQVCLEGRTAGLIALDPAVKSRGRISKRWGLRINVDVSR